MSELGVVGVVGVVNAISTPRPRWRSLRPPSHFALLASVVNNPVNFAGWSDRF